MPKILRSKCKKSPTGKHAEGLDKPKKKRGVWGSVGVCRHCGKETTGWRRVEPK